MNCLRAEGAVDAATGRKRWCCSLDREMPVNRRMHCEGWRGLSNVITFKRKGNVPLVH